MKTYKIGNKLFEIVSISLPFVLFFLFMNAHEVVAQSVPQKKKLIFIDTFEFGKVEDRWHSAKSEIIKIRTNFDLRHVHSGSRSMEVIALPGKGAGGMASIWFMPGYDRVHVRWYCKFSTNFDQGNLMHLNKLIAGRSRWSGYGTAGKRPSGLDFFRTSLDVWRGWGRNPPPGEPVLYSYFPLMKIDRKTGKHYGNIFKPKKNVLIRQGRWYCMEMMLKANVVGRSNGEQAFWINGKLIGHFKNITWRHTNDLRINSFSLGLYIHDNRKINRIWYDDVVVSTGFIGL